MEKYSKDPIINNIVKRILKRSNEGIIKYGTTMQEAVKSPTEWINEAQEELYDSIVYLEKLKDVIKKDS